MLGLDVFLVMTLLLLNGFLLNVVLLGFSNWVRFMLDGTDDFLLRFSGFSFFISEITSLALFRISLVFNGGGVVDVSGSFLFGCLFSLGGLF